MQTWMRAIALSLALLTGQSSCMEKKSKVNTFRTKTGFLWWQREAYLIPYELPPLPGMQGTLNEDSTPSDPVSVSLVEEAAPLDPAEREQYVIDNYEKIRNCWYLYTPPERPEQILNLGDGYEKVRILTSKHAKKITDSEVSLKKLSSSMRSDKVLRDFEVNVTDVQTKVKDRAEELKTNWLQNDIGQLVGTATLTQWLSGPNVSKFLQDRVASANGVRPSAINKVPPSSVEFFKQFNKNPQQGVQAILGDLVQKGEVTLRQSAAASGSTASALDNATKAKLAAGLAAKRKSAEAVVEGAQNIDQNKLKQMAESMKASFNKSAFFLQQKCFVNPDHRVLKACELVITTTVGIAMFSAAYAFLKVARNSKTEGAMSVAEIGETEIKKFAADYEAMENMIELKPSQFNALSLMPGQRGGPGLLYRLGRNNGRKCPSPNDVARQIAKAEGLEIEMDPVMSSAPERAGAQGSTGGRAPDSGTEPQPRP